VSLGLRQAGTLIAMLAERAADPREVAERFDGWCTRNIRPWYEDHLYWDATLLRRFDGADIDIEARIPSDVVRAAAEADPAIAPAAGAYLAMRALPSVLDPVQDNARAALRTGWRPGYADGPTRDELADVLTRPRARQFA
jgi:hypothetical protein